MLIGRAPLTVSCGLCVLLAAVVSPALAQDRLNSLIAVEQGAIPFQDLIDLNADPFGFAEGRHHLRVSQGMMDELRRRGVAFDVLYEDLDAAYKTYRAGLISPRSVEEFSDYHSLEQVEAKMMQLAADYPDIVAMEEIGRSIEDRPIYALRISDNAPQIEPDEPGMLVTGCHHAREWISVSVPLFFADYLAENYLKDAQVTRLITYGELWIVPVLNPDGYAYTWTEEEGARWWRKNRRDNGDGTMGVDPNRNYSVGFDGPGASDSTSSDTYHGPSAFSEPETQAVRDLLQGGFGRSFVTGLSYHNYSQLVMYPNGFVDEPVSNVDYYRPLAEEMTRLINDSHDDAAHDYVAHRTSGLYVASGVFTDWVHYAMGMTAFIIELRPKGPPFFELPPNEIIPTCQENLPPFLYLAEQTMIPGVVVADTDDDGLTGADDLCPDSPTARIDAQGCDDSQQDADNDGISGADDLCVDSLPGQQVDEFGCRLAPMYGIEVSSNADGVPVAIEPPDVDGFDTATSSIEGQRHEYALAETITLSAPETYQGLVFHRWVIDGLPIEAGQALAIIEGGEDVVARAEYIVPVRLDVEGVRRLPDVRESGSAYKTNYEAMILFSDGSTQAQRDVTWTVDNEEIGLVAGSGQFVPYEVSSTVGERFATLTAEVELGTVRMVSPPFEMSVYDASSVEPRCVEISISGPDELPSGETAEYEALVRRDGESTTGLLPGQANWVIEFADDGPHDGVRTMPSIADGMLDAGRTDADTEVIIAAAYLNDDGTSCIAQKMVTLRAVEGEVLRENPTPGVTGTCGATGGAALILMMLGLIGMRFTRR